MTRVLGIEGTAWAASAAIFDTDADRVIQETDAYQPEQGGIHPREAAEHMHAAVPQVIEAVLDRVQDEFDDTTDPPVNAVAFSRGPGLGPCLRITGTAARALSGSLSVPLVGVNHMVAHLEIGRHRSGFDAPVGLNASGANAHVLALHDGRYRVLGETMDTGVGNAIDKFTRHVGWTHPGGPKVEEAARTGDYVELPYVVKGMDFSFSGITSAAQELIEEGIPVEDVCCGLQETVFGMLCEVSERALSLTGRDELVLGGGVGQNARLCEMLSGMCAERGARLYVPEPRFLRDNGGMIAVLGATMFEASDTIPIEDSGVRPDFRPDQVPVTWREQADPPRQTNGDGTVRRGAEATVEIGETVVAKRRVPREYRHPSLDERLRRERTAAEARLLGEARRLGVPTPVIRDVDPAEGTIVCERVGRADLDESLTTDRVRDVGRHLARLHAAGIVHGDPTTRNIRVGSAPHRNGSDRTAAIDFGLGFHTDDVEDFAMDLHVFEQNLAGTADDADALRVAAEDAYAETGDPAVIDRLRRIERRGRYRAHD